MSGERTFHRTMTKILKEQPDSDISKTILKIKGLYPNKNDYYSIFDDLSCRLRVNLYAQPFLHNKKDTIIGYQPRIQYFPDNLLNEKPRIRELREKVTLLTIPRCNRILAETFITELSRISNLDEILSSLD